MNIRDRPICVNGRLDMFDYCATQVNIDPGVVRDIGKIRIEHDGRQPGKGWRLDKVCIVELTT